MMLSKRQHHWQPTSPPRDEGFTREINPRRELELTESEQQDSTMRSLLLHWSVPPRLLDTCRREGLRE
jgi:hypothetical protein